MESNLIPSFASDGLHYEVRSYEEATTLLLDRESCLRLTLTAKRFGRKYVKLFWPDCENRPLELLASMADENDSIQKPKESRIITIGEVREFSTREDCDGEISRLLHYDNQHACWIIDQRTQEVLGCNRVALLANEKPPREILAADISALWNPESLRSLTELVNRDTVVNEHVNIGYRWKNFDSNWGRVRHEFNVDYALVNYLGVPCRFEIVKNAVPV